MWAGQANTRGSRGNDPDLERYLRTEFLGGTSLDALRRDPWPGKYSEGRPTLGRITRRPRGVRTSTRERARSAIVRIVTTVMVYLRRVKPVPAGQEA